MGFQLRSKGSSPCLQEAPLTKTQQQSKNLENQITVKKDDLSKYVPQSKDSLIFTKSFQVPNRLGNNRTQAESISERMFDQQSQGMNIQGYAGSNQGGGIFSDTKTIGGTSTEPLSWSDGTKSTVTQEDMKRTLLKFGGAKVVNGVLTPVTTHENRNQYDVRQNNITKLESLLNKNTNSEATRTAKKQTFEANKTKKAQELATARSTKKQLIVDKRNSIKKQKAEKRALLLSKRAEYKKKIEAKKKAKLQNQR